MGAPEDAPPPASFDDPSAWSTPESAAEALVALERRGKRFHELRDGVAAVLARPDVHVPTFAARWMELVLRARDPPPTRGADPDRSASPDGPDGGASSLDRKNRDAPIATIPAGDPDPLVHVILESLSRAPLGSRELAARARLHTTVKRTRFAAPADRKAAAPLVLAALGVRIRQDSAASASAASAVLEPRAVVRLAETYGLDESDLVDVGGAEASARLRAYVAALFRDGRRGPAVHLTLHFSILAFASEETLAALVASRQFDLATALCEASRTAFRSRFVELCYVADDHAGYRAAYNATREFPELAERFPNAKKKYFESTVARMLEKGQSEAALRYAGEDPGLRLAVVRGLLERGDAVTASEFAERLGMMSSSSPSSPFSRADFPLLSGAALERAAAARREAHLQLPAAVRVRFVDTEAGLAAVRDALRGADAIGLDVEWAAELGGGADEEEGGEKAGGGGGRRRGGGGGRRRRRGERRGAGEKKGGEASEGDNEASDSELDSASDSELPSESDSDSAQRRLGALASSVALFQVATRTDVFLLDLPALIVACPDRLRATIGATMSDAGVLKLGFGVAEDLNRLAKAHPPTFGRRAIGGRGVGPVLDVQHLWRAGAGAARAEAETTARRAAAKTTSKTRRKKNAARTGREDEGGGGGDGEGDVKGSSGSSGSSFAGPWSAPAEMARRDAVGLSHLCGAVLGKPLDKSPRMSDWGRRPLSQRQMAYAALDAWVLVEIVARLGEEHGEELERLARGLRCTRE